MANEKTAEAAIKETAEQYRNWGRWGPEDQTGTLNFITPDKIVKAARLVQKGKVFALGLPFDQNGPQTGARGRFNPILTFRRDGSDAIAGNQPFGHGFGAADDIVCMPLQCGTQWDALAHIFDHGKMWNGYSAAEVSSAGARRNGIQNIRDKVVTRGVLLDMARFKKADSLTPGYAITVDDLTGCIKTQGGTSSVGTGDIVLVRTGQLGHCKKDGWGTYAGGDAPGLSFSTAGWLHDSQIAGVASDTWGLEVRPNELPDSFQPLHQVMIPNMGLLVGEIFDMDALAADCAADGVYDFLFVAPPLPFTGAVGSPVNPYAIK